MYCCKRRVCADLITALVKRGFYQECSAALLRIGKAARLSDVEDERIPALLAHLRTIGASWEPVVAQGPQAA